MLTKESKTVLYHLYKEYQVRCSNGLSRSFSKEFGSSEEVQELLFPDWSVDDVDDYMRELKQAGYLEISCSSGIIYESNLTNEAIAHMENQRKDTFLNVASFVAQFIP